jgi:hypothetical protein
VIEDRFKPGDIIKLDRGFDHTGKFRAILLKLDHQECTNHCSSGKEGDCLLCNKATLEMWVFSGNCYRAIAEFPKRELAVFYEKDLELSPP